MSKLLIDENPLIVIPSLAAEFGLLESIILQQIHYWIEHVGPDGRKYGKIANGKRWIRNTVEQWQESNFPFASTSQIYRALKSLESSGVVLSRSDLNSIGYDRTKWYTIDYAILQIREMEFSFSRNPFYASEETIPETTTEITREVKKEKEPENIFQCYEQVIGLVTQPLVDDLVMYEDEFDFEWIKDAFKLAAERNARNWRYVKKILDNWQTNGKDWYPGKKEESQPVKREPRQEKVINPFTGEVEEVTVI